MKKPRILCGWLLALCLLLHTGLALAKPRVISLAPNVTELIYAAGGGDYMVGTVRHSDYPPAAKKLDHIGNGVEYSTEAILAKRPTLVVAWQKNMANQQLAQRLKVQDTPVIYAHPKKLEDIPNILRRLGQRLGTYKLANTAAKRFENKIKQLTPANHSPKVYIDISHNPVITIGDDPVINNLLRHCGAKNIFGQQKLSAPQVSVESVISKNPDYLLIATHNKAQAKAVASWWARHGLAAAQKGHVIYTNPDWLFRPGPRLIKAAEAVCQGLH